MKKALNLFKLYFVQILFIFLVFLFPKTFLHSKVELEKSGKLVIVGGGIAGAMEAYYAHLDAKKNNKSIQVTIYEKNESILDTTVTHIAPSLTPDEILSVVPRGQELVRKLQIIFSEPAGIRVEDVSGIDDSEITRQFKGEVQNYSLDELGHALRTKSLLALGKMSMDLWQNIYVNADLELRNILESSNFNPCREQKNDIKMLHDGYRIDLVYNVPNAREHALSMKNEYESLGYKNCAILSPVEVMKIDPYLSNFCKSHTNVNENGELDWHNDSIVLWRPGGCIDAKTFLPKFYEYLRKIMGTYINVEGKEEDIFQINFGKNVTNIEFMENYGTILITGLVFEDGSTSHDDLNCKTQYVFCPGESVGTLRKLGLCEPAYAGFAGASLILNIDVPCDKIKKYENFSHCMEVHQEGVVLAWQARFEDNKICIAVAGTKAFYGDQKPDKDQSFAKNRNLLQLNMINDIFPQFVSLALNYDTAGKTLSENDLQYLESKNIVTRWAGIRAVAYDGFPSLGYVYKNGVKVANARCTTHLGSGGVSFSPASVVVSRKAISEDSDFDEFMQDILRYSDSSRSAHC